MKKILYITTVSRTINAFLIPHIEMLIDKGYVVDCACFIDKPIDKRLISKGVKVYNVPFSRKPLSLRNLKAFWGLRFIQKINKYDVVHVHTPIAALYGRILKLWFPKIKIIYTAHGYHFYKGAPKIAWCMFYPMEKLMARFTDVIININNEDYEITKNKLKPKICYLVNGVGINIEDIRRTEQKAEVLNIQKLSFDKDDFIILMIAELNHNKNQLQLIKALELIKDKYPKIKAISVGEGNRLKELKEEIVKRGIEKNISFLGYRENINEFIKISDIGILLSYREGLPKSIMEFMSHGKKVIGTNIRGIRDLIENESIGKLVEVGDYEATARAIEEYYLEGDRSFNTPKEIEKYELNNVISELEYIYDSLDLQDYYLPEKNINL
ncbi:glycosyltransferase family 4 protein [Clostridium sulfidigenes]|uniref:glycosyltransferase family 4 protein n=1 Tax=Clostridium sulfidigenes TaxID=318464 RepID=UPI003F8B1272